MFTKTILALALALATSTGAAAANRHQASEHGKSDPRATAVTEPAGRDRDAFVIANMLFAGLHEMGHALADQLQLPLLGRSEDAADSFATITLIDEGSEFSLDVLVQAARGHFLSDRRDRKLGEEQDLYDAHSLDRQRAFQIVCMMVGSDRKRFKELAGWVFLPESRQLSCRKDYETARDAWHAVLEPHLRSAGRPPAAIAISYEDGRGKLEHYARSFQSIGLAESLADYVSNRYVLPRPISMVMTSCGDANAMWRSPSLTETLCYELADDFVDLYEGYTDKTTAHKKAANKLMARNISPVSLALNAASAPPKADAGAIDAAARRSDRLEKLALDLASSAAALFGETKRHAER